jgi:hypothetical protein
MTPNKTGRAVVETAAAHEPTAVRSLPGPAGDVNPAHLADFIGRVEAATGRAARRSGASWLCPCPAHDDRTPSLSVGLSADGAILIKCFAGCAAAAIVAAVGLRLRDLFPPRSGRGCGARVRARTIRSAAPPAEPAADLTGFAADCRAAARGRLGALAAALGLSESSLDRLGAGWATADTLRARTPAWRSDGAWTFPMTDAGGRVLGLRLRLTDGTKLAVRGGHDGLFIPVGLTGSGPLLVAEGPTDAAALLDLGFDSVGRPSCTGGVGLLIELVKLRKPADVVVVADADPPGRRGAAALAAVLAANVRRVRVVTPPAGVKDVRDWRTAGATRADVFAAIAAAPVRTLVYRTTRTGIGGAK